MGFFSKIGAEIGRFTSRQWVRDVGATVIGGPIGLLASNKSIRRGFLPYVPLTGQAYTGQIAAREQARAGVRQQQAQDTALADARRAERAAEEASNRVNRKIPDMAAALANARRGGRLGPAGTMLTGARGVDMSTLQVGRSTLLGG